VEGAYSDLPDILNGKEVEEEEQWEKNGGTQETEEMERKFDESSTIQLSERGCTSVLC